MTRMVISRKCPHGRCDGFAELRIDREQPTPFRFPKRSWAIRFRPRAKHIAATSKSGHLQHASRWFKLR
jgi:hypothetical protein